MNFRDAAEIAKRHPGATIARDDNGYFIVRLLDGRVVGPGSPTPTAVQRAPQNELDWYVQRCRQLQDTNLQLGCKVEELERQCSRLRQSADEMSSLAAELVTLKQDKEDLLYQLERVSPEIWAQIDEAERCSREDIQRETEARRRAQEQCERERILRLVRSGGLNYKRLLLIKDNAAALGFSQDELAEIEAELIKVGSNTYTGVTEQGCGVYSTTDGQ